MKAMARKIAPLALLVSLPAVIGTVALSVEPRAEPGAQRPDTAHDARTEAHDRTARDSRGSARRRPVTVPRPRRIRWRDSVAIGAPESGELVRGVKLPSEGRHYFTWDPILRQRPNRPWRRWGTDHLVRAVLRVAREFAEDHPRAPRIGIGDLSLEAGGYFGPEVSGGIGHATHQNGLDADVYYPLLSGAERAPESVDEIDLRLAQDLVDRFVAAGATRIYVGPSTPLTGPDAIVVPLVNHDNHLHVRIAG